MVDRKKVLQRCEEEGHLAPSEAALVESNINKETPDSEAIDPELTKESSGEQVDIRKLISEMSMAQKIKCAMLGSSICRGLLILDQNRLIQDCVLSNPRLQEGEIEDFSKNPHISDYVLRKISDNKSWMKGGVIRYNLVMNPKSPPDVSLKWLRYLRTSELRQVARSKGIPQLVAITARKRLADTKK